MLEKKEEKMLVFSKEKSYAKLKLKLLKKLNKKVKHPAWQHDSKLTKFAFLSSVDKRNLS